jgi:hypothetical protein
MWHEENPEREFFERLVEIDERIAMAVAAARCPRCGGPLHRANYERKPRGGLIGQAGEAFTRRYSLCCGREGCRKRALPPSLRFLGRRVYLEAVVLLATVRMMLIPAMRMAQEVTGVPTRTLRRWWSWWTEKFPKLEIWIAMRALFVPPPPEESGLPKSLLDYLVTLLGDAPTVQQVLALASRCLAPVTTQSVTDGSRFVSATQTG